MSLILKLVALIELLDVVFCVANGLSRDDFPSGFVFGASTSAYQVEGAADVDGRQPSIWDTFAHAGNGKMYEGDGDIACDQYHKYKEDVKLMANMGLEAYRFSISWSRLIPDGKGAVNPKGLQYYNNLINELISHGIQPHVTLHHFDLPQALEDEYGGWISRRIVKDFTTYADVCFREFGDRVKYWTTVNEPNIYAMFGYDLGAIPPQRCSPSSIFNCSRGNSSTEPYLAAHHMLLAHASAARSYTKKYKRIQHGFIGFNLLTFGLVPMTNTSEDISATQRTFEFTIGWFMNPLTYGDYPDIMKKNAGSRLPSFTRMESNLVKGSIDFLGINFYGSMMVKDSPNSLHLEHRDYIADMAVLLGLDQSDTNQFPTTPPETLLGVLESLKNAYGNFPIYIHENGMTFGGYYCDHTNFWLDHASNGVLGPGIKTPRNSSLDDWPRVKYLDEYIGSLVGALRSGLNVKGYFVWSFVDVFEILSGYESSFGLYYIDMKDPTLKRQPKLSAKWFSNFLKKKPMDPKIIMGIEKNSAALLSDTPLLQNVA